MTLIDVAFMALLIVIGSFWIQWHTACSRGGRGTHR
jgi:hypothetical protein